MKTQLIKLQDKFILVNDEEIQIDDNYIAWETNYATEPKERWVMYNRVNGLNGTNQKKIISENPDFSDLKEEDCKKIGWVDVEKLATDYGNIFSLEGGHRNYAAQGWLDGFKTAQSLNDKMFSLEDMEEYLKLYRIHIETDIKSKSKWVQTPSEFIQSLQQTVWDVEVEMEEVLPSNGNVHDWNKPIQPKITNNSIKITKIL